MLAIFYSPGWKWLGAMSANQDKCELYRMIYALRESKLRGLRIVLADQITQREVMQIRFNKEA